MRFLNVALLVGTLTAHSTVAHAQATPATAPELARLQGRWVMVAGVANGYTMPPSVRESMLRTLTADHLVVTMTGRTFFEATLVIHPDSTPAGIDYHMTGGPTSGAVQLGIYRWAADTVEFCFAGANRPRPADFSTTAGDGRTWSRWVRAE